MTFFVSYTTEVLMQVGDHLDHLIQLGLLKLHCSDSNLQSMSYADFENDKRLLQRLVQTGQDRTGQSKAVQC